MYVSKTDVATPCGSSAAPIDAKDYGSAGVHMVTNCGVGASNPKAIYIRPFCIDAAVFEGDEAPSDGEMPIRKALTPVEFAQDLKEELERIAPTRILRDNESPRLGWLVEGQFDMVDGGSPLGRFFFVEAVEYDETAVAKHLRGEGMRGHLEALDAAFSALVVFDSQSTETTLRAVADARCVKAAVLIHATRVAITGRSVSPGLFEVAELLGRERTHARICAAVRLIA